MKVTGWTDWDNPEYTELDVGRYAEAYGVVAKEMRARGYKFTGSYHQNGDYGVPIIDNKWLFQVSQRTWGNVMVTAYPDETDNSDGLGYTEWAWIPPNEMVVPNNDNYINSHT